MCEVKERISMTMTTTTKTIMKTKMKNSNNNSLRRRRTRPPLSLSRNALLLFVLATLLSLQHSVIVHAQAPQTTSSASKITGYAFFDSSKDGSRDPTNPLDYGIYDISVYLFTCSNDILRTTKTDPNGYYQFESAPYGDDNNGGFYVSVKTIPSWYAFSEAKSEDANAVIVDPETGNSECFDLVPGEEKELSFGFVFTTTTTAEPTVSPTYEALVGGAPGTTTAPTETALVIGVPGTNEPSKNPTYSPTVPEPTYSPTTPASVVIGGYAFEDLDDDGSFEEMDGERRIPGVAVSLTSCSLSGDNNGVDQVQILSKTVTNSTGYYRFDEVDGEDIPAGAYSVTFSYDCVDDDDNGLNNGSMNDLDMDAEGCYAGSSVWSGNANNNVFDSVSSGTANNNVFDPASPEALGDADPIAGRNPASSDSDSDADPLTGRTVCQSYVNVEEGETIAMMVDLNVNAGMKLVTNAPTVEPTNAPTKVPSNSPSKSPLVSPTMNPTSDAPTLSPSVNPTTAYPTAAPNDSPSQIPSIEPTIIEPSSDPSSSPSGSLSPSDLFDVDFPRPGFGDGGFRPGDDDMDFDRPGLGGPGNDDMDSGFESRPTGSPTVTNSPSTSSMPTLPTSSPTIRTTSAQPTVSPTLKATRAGSPHGPEITERLIMTIRGLGGIEFEELWALETAKYVADHFNTGEGSAEGGVFDAEISIVVTGQKKLGRRLLRDGNDANFVKEQSLRQLQESVSLEITYTQTSTYKTPDPIKYDGIWVATKPFESREGSANYIKLLQTLSPEFLAVTSIGSIRVAPPPPVEVRKSEEGDGDGSSIGIIVGAVCGGLMLVVALAMFIRRRRKKKREGEEYMEPVGNGPPSSMPGPTDLENGDGDGSSSSSSQSSYEYETVEPFSSPEQASNPPVDTVSDLPMIERRENASTSSSSSGLAHPSNGLAHLGVSETRRRSNRSDTDEVLLDSLFGSQDNSSELILHVIAPAGRLGIIVDTHPEGGPAYVCEIKDMCPIADSIRLEDKVIAVDDEDVQELTAVSVSKILARKARNPRRKITILRYRDRNDGHNDSFMSGRTEESTDRALEGAHMSSDKSLQTVPTSSTAESSSVLPMTENTAGNSNNNNDSASNAGEGYAVEETMIDIIAPSGKLGVVLVTPEPEDGPPFIFNIRDESPLKDKVKINDKIIAVDGEDVSKMTAIDVSNLLGSKSSHERREITVLREVVKSHGDEATEPRLTVDSAAAIVDTSARSGARFSTAAMTPDPELEKSSGSFLENRVIIIAPAGKLGVVVDSPPEGGAAYVSDIKTDSPLRDQIKYGDRLIEVDGEDVSNLKAIHVSMLLGSKSRNAKREITVLREAEDTG